MIDEYAEEREALRRNMERDETELREAVEDLRRGMARPLHLIDAVARYPLPWLVGGVLVGIWLGSTRPPAER